MMDTGYKIVAVFSDGRVQEETHSGQFAYRAFSNFCAEPDARFVVMMVNNYNGDGYHLYQSWTR